VWSGHSCPLVRSETTGASGQECPLHTRVTKVTSVVSWHFLRVRSSNKLRFLVFLRQRNGRDRFRDGLGKFIQRKEFEAASERLAAGKGDLTDQKQRITEAEAIEQAKQGQESAFEILYNLHKRRVYSLCLRMVSNPAQAEDLAQEAFLQLFRKIGTFRGESAFSTWLHRMTVNVVLMQLRKKGLPAVSLEETLEADDEAPRKEFGTQDVKLTGSIDRLQLQRAIDKLPPGYKTVFVLHDVEGFEHNEIAEIVGCSIGNSKSQLHKARLKLRDYLKFMRAEKAKTG